MHLALNTNTQPSPSSPPAFTWNADDPVVQRILQAAAHCVALLGPDKTTGDEIARASGISRATVYRRFSGIESIFEALLYTRSLPFVAPVLKLLEKKGNIADRMEAGMLFALTEMSRDPCLNAFYVAGWATPNLQLIRTAYEQLFGETLVPLIYEAYLRGELRQTVPFNELLSWQLSQFLQLAAQAPLDKRTLRHRIRHFILPVMLPDSVRQ